MLKLLLASIALVFSWSWLRAELSRVGDPALRPSALVVRGAVLVASFFWFVGAVFGVIGGVMGWLILAGVVALLVKILLEPLRKRETAPAPGGESEAGGKPDA